MTEADLRPLSLGEILDRTFTLYRRHFLLFIGIAGIPQLAVMFLSGWINWLSLQADAPVFLVGVLYVPYVVSAVFAYLFSQGGSVLAVSRLYLGQAATIADSLTGVWGSLASLFFAAVMNTITIVVGMFFLIFPGIFLLCRLLVFLPATVLEQKSPFDSLSRSFELTRGYAGRAFMVVLLYGCLLITFQMLVALGTGLILFIPGGEGEGLPRLQILLTSLATQLTGVLVTPILLIGTSVFYYDLRVRKEGFDLQLMMQRQELASPSQGPPPLPL